MSALRMALLMYLPTILKELVKQLESNKMAQLQQSVATNEVFIYSNPPVEFQSILQLCPSIWEKPYNEGTDHQISNLEGAINGDIFRPYCQKCQDEFIYC